MIGGRIEKYFKRSRKNLGIFIWVVILLSLYSLWGGDDPSVAVGLTIQGPVVRKLNSAIFSSFCKIGC